MTTPQSAAFTKKLFESDPCRQMPFAHSALIAPEAVLAAASKESAYDAESDRRETAYDEERRRESRAHWGAVFGIVAGAVVAQHTNNTPTPTYSGNPTPAQGSYGAETSGGSAYGGSGTATSPAGSGTANRGMYPVQAVHSCMDYTLLPAQANYKYFQIRNTCNYGIQVYVKVTEDGRWTTYADMSQEIGPLGIAKSRGVLANVQMFVTIKAVCPSRRAAEFKLQRKLAGVYTRNNGAFGCWAIDENTGVGRAN